MKDAIRQLDREYHLDLSEDEIEQIARQAEAAQRLIQKLFEVNVEGIVPALQMNPAGKR